MENGHEYMDHNFEGNICLERIKSKIAWDMPKMHSHNYHELYFLISGSRQYLVGLTNYDVSTGDVVIIPQNVLHRTSGGVAGYERYALYFSDSIAYEFKHEVGEERFFDLLQMGCVNLPEEKKEKIHHLLNEMEKEKIRGDTFSNIIMKKQLYEIFVIILRYGCKAAHRENKKTDAIEQVLRFINENFSQEITLSFAAKMAYMEETYFSKRFKQLTGFGFSEYLTHTRIKMAEELLKNSDLSISAISDQCGFSSGNYFGDAFKRMRGLSPSTYRKVMRENVKKEAVAT